MVSKTVMKDAIAINNMEPDSNFFLANLLSAKGNLTGAMHHYKQSVQMKPDYAAALQFILVRKTILSSLSTPSMDYRAAIWPFLKLTALFLTMFDIHM